MKVYSVVFIKHDDGCQNVKNEQYLFSTRTAAEQKVIERMIPKIEGHYEKYHKDKDDLGKYFNDNNTLKKKYHTYEKMSEAANDILALGCGELQHDWELTKIKVN